MSIRADWGGGDTVVAEPHPPVMAQSSTMTATMQPMGETPLDLTTPEPQLRARLGELIDREAVLFEKGITCPLRDAAESNCSACPVNHATEDQRLSALCRVGAEQERVTMLLIAQRRGIGR